MITLPYVKALLLTVDGKAMQRFEADPDPAVQAFIAEPRNVYLSMCIDGFNPHDSGTTSISPILLMLMTLPAHVSFLVNLMFNLSVKACEYLIVLTLVCHLSTVSIHS